ncbi:MAG TPA: VIT1/CCC1 transporter family protein, partial [Acidimicrobiia bacterium]|nr:VIT1/CCC1 transporter family protein [Acidimicrobiia bacterium]
FVSFAIGAFIPVIPFLFGAGTAALAVAVGLSAVTLFGVGSAIALLTGRSPLRGGVRMVAIAAVVGLASNLIGRLIGHGVQV